MAMKKTGLKAADFIALKKVIYEKDAGIVIIQRVEDTVYLCNGHMIVKLPYIIYSHDMDKNFFPDIEDGKTYSRNWSAYNKDWNKDAEQDISKIFVNAIEDAKKAMLTKLNLDMGGYYTRLFVVSSQLAAINTKYFDVAIRFVNSASYVYGTNRIAPIALFDRLPGEDSFAFMILPVNMKDYDTVTLKDFLAA